MSKSYVKVCNFCQTEIVMSEQANGKWAPFSPTGGPHVCSVSKPVASAPEPKDKKLSLEMLDIRLKRVEDKLFIYGGLQK